MKAAVLGAGCWGTTFAQVLIDAGTETTLWARRAEVSDAINATHRNEQYLPGIDLPRELRATADPHTAVNDADVVLIALPAQQLRQNLTAWTPLIGDDASLISLMKGIEAGTAERMSQVIQQVTGAESDRVLVLSGPNLAHEIAARHPTATVIAGSDPLRCAQLQAACSTSYLRPYTNADVIGTELAGSVKNVIALACGMAAGMGYGDNTVASVITRGLAEISRLGVVLGADPATFAGLAGLGDLVATCTSPQSRNRGFGVHLGTGASMAQAQAAMHGQVAEGVRSCRAVIELADRHGVDMPISRQVTEVCEGRSSPADSMRSLMRRVVKSE